MSATFQETFADQGYLHLKGYFRASAIELLEETITRIFAMQARKIGEYRKEVDLALSFGPRVAQIADILTLLEDHDKEAGYQAQKFLRRSQIVRRFYDQAFIELCADLIGCDPGTTLLEGPDLFVNKPGENRLKYQYHTEALYYPKRRRFINIWLPLFGPRTVANGAMTVRPQSHKRVWDASLMNEYSGWSKDDEGKRNQFTQLEIPEFFLGDYKRYECESTPGDAILFDRNLIHKSNHNETDDTSFALVCRVWNPCDDLTLSGDMEVTPYRGGNLGRAGLVVRP